jgi:hypothetical protein
MSLTRTKVSPEYASCSSLAVQAPRLTSLYITHHHKHTKPPLTSSPDVPDPHEGLPRVGVLLLPGRPGPQADLLISALREEVAACGGGVMVVVMMLMMMMIVVLFGGGGVVVVVVWW